LALEGQQDVEELEHNQSLEQEEVYGQMVQVQVQEVEVEVDVDVDVDEHDRHASVGSSHGSRLHFVVFQEIFAQEQAVDAWEVNQDDAHFFQLGVQHSELVEVMWVELKDPCQKIISYRHYT
jgi:hypothetical protein